MESARTVRRMTLAFFALSVSIATASRAGETEGTTERLIGPVPPLVVLLTVGSDAECDYDDLDAAITDSLRFGKGQHVLRIAQNYAHPVRSTVYNRSLYFEGGYATCSSTERSGRTDLEGVGVDNLFDFVETDGGSYEMVLDGLRLSGGGGNVGGGVIVIGEGMTLRVRGGTSIHGNAVSDRGGGIFVARADLILEDGTTVSSNTAFAGGGIYCTDGKVELDQGTIAFNQALQGENAQIARGGGIFAQGCRVETSAGGPFAGIVGNAAQSGGGIFAASSTLILSGTSGHPATVDSNTAGGGITASSTTLSAKNASISGNVGSGIDLTSSNLLIDRADNCFDDDRCSQVSGNSGSGVVVRDSFAAILQTYIEGNGSAIRVIETSGATLILSNSVLANNSPNGGPAIFASGGDLSLFQSTIIGERRDRGLIGGLVSHLDLRNTLLWRRSPAGVGAPVFPILATGPVELDCGIFDSTSDPGSNVSGIRVFEQDPSFVDLPGGDYHLRSDSPAIDRCEPLSPPERDIDRQERGADIAGVGDPTFPDDIGADEFHFTVVEIGPAAIFEDGFESGDLSAWQVGG